MVGSTSFSSGARISVIPSFADLSIAASCLGCQQNRFWNDRHRGGFTHHGQDRSFDFARGIPTGYSSTVRGSTVQWPLFTFHNFEHWYLQYQYFLWNRSASYSAVLCLQSHLLLVVCPLCHHHFFNRMSTTYCTVVLLYYHYLCCCVASCYKYCLLYLSSVPFALT